MIPFLIIFCGALVICCICWAVSEMFKLQDKINDLRHKELLKEIQKLKEWK